ncbi:hypothetical protein ZWY2020_021718 [Hordeum vulgare]|nr:hypothetical protein ZWY2020_021718 [Hordeum vulgare]
MRASCNGSRVLCKGCADDYTICPCLAWMRSPYAQANTTIFLAKFYGRAGLINLLAAAHDDAHHLGLFRSLLYEACGRATTPYMAPPSCSRRGTGSPATPSSRPCSRAAPVRLISPRGPNGPPDP